MPPIVIYTKMAIVVRQIMRHRRDAPDFNRESVTKFIYTYARMTSFENKVTFSSQIELLTASLRGSLQVARK